jgi:hypothetical protein
MNELLEFTKKLYQLSDISREIAQLLEKINHKIPLQDPAPIKINEDKPVGLLDILEWPAADADAIDYASSPFLKELLELNNGPILELVPDMHKSILSNKLDRTYDCMSTENHPGDIVRLLKWPEKKYDLIILNHYLELTDSPTATLQECKKHLTDRGKVYIIIRPWTSSDGGYQSSYMNKAFLHLCYDLNHNEDVKNKFIDPRADVQFLCESSDLTVQNKNFHTQQLPAYISQNDSILNRIIGRTWGNIRTRNALSILEIVGMEVVLGR